MEQFILKPEIVDKIKVDANLFASIANAIEVSVFTLPAVLNKNSPKLTQKSCLVAIANHLKIRESEILVKQKTKEQAA